MLLTSPAFRNETPIPKRFTGDGQDLSPPLQWLDAPAETQSFALICDDPDAPVRPGKEHPYVHWLIYGIPATMHNLPEGVPPIPALPGALSALQGKNSFDRIGYGGPMPPIGHGVHHYHFALYALDIDLDIDPEATKAELLQAMQGHILARATLVGTYERGIGRAEGLMRGSRENAREHLLGEGALVLSSLSDEEELRRDRNDTA
jgi:Raf kinase inhibitor-like YbhB/YbcL family protein